MRRAALVAALLTALLGACASEVPAISLPPLPTLPPRATDAPPSVTPTVAAATCTGTLPAPAEPKDPARSQRAWATVVIELACGEAAAEYAAYSDVAVCPIGPSEGTLSTPPEY